MQYRVIAPAFVMAISACSSTSPLPDLTGVDRIEIWDLRIQDLHAKPQIVTAAKAIADIVGIVQSTGDGWRSGSFTPPSGYLRFNFMKASQNVVGVGLGPRFLVVGAASDWYSKDISAEAETSLQQIANASP